MKRKLSSRPINTDGGAGKDYPGQLLQDGFDELHAGDARSEGRVRGHGDS